MIKFFDRTVSIGIKMVWCLFGLMIFWLFIVTGYTTVRMDNSAERSYIIHDSMIMNILFSILVTVLLAAAYRCFVKLFQNKTNGKDMYSHLSVTILMILLFAGIMFVISTQNQVRADQYYVVECAENIINHDYSCLGQGGYLDMYPNQLGIVLTYVFLSYIFGTFNTLAFQLINIGALGMLYKYITDFSKEIFGESTGVLSCVVMLVSLPLILYTTFVYGTILGLACSLGSLFYLYNYSKDHGPKKLVVGILLCAIAVFVKQNYLIFAIGLGIYCLLEVLVNKNMLMWLALVGILISLSFGSFVPKHLTGIVTGKNDFKGVSSLSFIAMGLQENSSLYKYNGWWNNYNADTYAKAGYDSEKQSEIAMEYIKNRALEFQNDAEYAVSFFSGKNVSQWGNPDFQGFWINQVMPHEIRMRNPKWVAALLSVRGCEAVSKCLNLLQFWIVAGSLIFSLFCKKDNGSLCLITIFIGGFIFHTFWEAKGQYTLPYFVCLLPIACAGWVYTIKQSVKLVENLKSKKRRITGIGVKKLSIIMVLALVTVVVSFCKETSMPERVFAFDQYSDYEFQEFLSDNS